MTRAVLLAVVVLAASPARAQELEPSPEAQRLIAERDAHAFHLVLAAYGTFAAADVATSAYSFGAGRGRELWLGPTSSPVAFGLLKGSMTALAAWSLRRLHQRHPRAAFWTALAATGLEGGITAHNARIGRVSR